MERKFKLLISKGNIDEIIHFYNNNDFTISYHIAFETACMFENINVAKWIFETFINNNTISNIHRTNGLIIRNLVRSGLTKIVKWIIEDLFGSISDLQDQNEFFLDICQSGNLELAIWFMSKIDYNIDIHQWSNQIFRFLCCNKYLEFAKWFITLDTVESFNIHYNNNQIFKTAYSNRDIDLLNWLITLDTVESFDIHYNNNELLRNTGSHSNELNLVKWLFSLDTIESFDIHYNDNELIKRIIKHQHSSDFLKWFLNLDTIESFTDTGDLFEIACNNRMLENAKYLWYSNDIETDIHYDNNSIMRWYIKNFWCIGDLGLEFFNWIITLDTRESFMIDINNIEIERLHIDPRVYEQIVSFFGIENFEIKFQFAYFCRIGNLEGLERIYENNIINIHLNNGLFFEFASFYGHLEVVKWLLSIGSFDYFFDPPSYAKYHDILRRICTKGHVDIVELLVDIDDTKSFLNESYGGGIHNRSSNQDSFFTRMCICYNYNNKKPMIEWLVNQGILSSATKDDFIKLLKNVKFSNNIDFFQWILSLDDTIDIHLQNDIILNNAIKNDNSELVEFILSLDSIDSFDIYTLLLKNPSYRIILNSKCNKKCDKILIEAYKKSGYINGFIFETIKNCNLDDYEIYLFVDDDYLNDDEKEMKYKLKRSINIIENFLFKCYYKPNGFNANNMINKIIKYD